MAKVVWSGLLRCDGRSPSISQSVRREHLEASMGHTHLWPVRDPFGFVVAELVLG